MTLRRIDPGSVRLLLDISPEGLQRLVELFEAGQLTEILGFPIQDLLIEDEKSVTNKVTSDESLEEESRFEENVASASESSEVIFNEQKRYIRSSGKNYAVVIGINQYRFLQPLRYAKRDAEAMSEFLRQEARFDHVFLLTDDSSDTGGKPTEPFRANFLRILRQISEEPFMGNGDNFWFFFSGHGIRYNDQDYLMPLDGDPRDVENSGIPTTYITESLRRCGADNVVMILDACRNVGIRSREGIGRQTGKEARQTGVISIFSCSPHEYSHELESIEQGAFTYALIEGLGIRGRCATIAQLDQYLQSQVPQLLQQLGRVGQTPYTIAEPLNRSHLILMPQHATLTDIATLKNDAYSAEIARNWELAIRLWLRVLVAASGQDVDAANVIRRDAVSAIGQIERKRLDEFQLTAVQPTPSSIPLKPVTPSKPSTPRISTPASPRVFPPTSLSSPSRQLTRRQFLKWGIPAGVGIVGVTIASQFLGNKSYSVDLSKLEEFLKAGQWREADQETARLMLKAANREKEGWLDDDSVRNFPCDVLSMIDQLWIQNSPEGKFGFSVQKKIYVEECDGKLNGEYDAEALLCLYERVGWQQIAAGWVSSRSLTFDTSAPIGHLPVLETLRVRGDSSFDITADDMSRSALSSSLFFQRLGKCNIR